MSAALTTQSRPNRCDIAVHALGPWEALDRFLVLGSSVGTYYASARELRIEHLGNLLHCLDLDGPETVARIRLISTSNRAPRNMPAVLALAMAASLGLRSPSTGHHLSSDRTGDTPVRAATRKLALEAMPHVCRIPTDLFAWASWVRRLRGWGPALARAVARWYQDVPVDRLALHAIKYQERHGIRHADLIRLSHPRVGADDLERQAVIRWMVQGGIAQGLDLRDRALAQGIVGNPTPSGTVRQLEGAEDLLALNRPAALATELLAREHASQRAAARELRRLKKERMHALAVELGDDVPTKRPHRRDDSSLGLFGVSTRMLRAAGAMDYVPEPGEESVEAHVTPDRPHRAMRPLLVEAVAQATPRPSLFQEEDVTKAVSIIERCSLPHEAVPSHLKRERRVWDALLVDMPMKAMLRNLSVMTIAGVLEPGNQAARHVADRLQDPVLLSRARIHPVALLMAAETYRMGHRPLEMREARPRIWGRKEAWQPKRQRRPATWIPVPGILAALDRAFVLAFGNVVPSRARIMNSLDVSRSMGCPIMHSGLSARAAAAAMALVSIRTEEHATTVGFSSADPGGYMRRTRDWSAGRQLVPGLSSLDVGRDSTLRQVIDLTSGLPFGSTDCALPVTYALEAGLEVDCFVTYTDNEHNSGPFTPSQALARYRQATGIPARMICVGMTATDYTIADPADPLCLNVAGFDSAVPTLIADFAAGRV